MDDKSLWIAQFMCFGPTLFLCFLFLVLWNTKTVISFHTAMLAYIGVAMISFFDLFMLFALVWAIHTG